MPLRFSSAGEAARYLRMVVELDGAEGAEEALKELEKVGTHAAQAMERDWEAVSRQFEELGGKVSQVGGILTQGITVPIAALSAAATAMTFDILQSEEALATLSIEGQQSARELQTSVDDLKGEFGELKATVAESVMPTITMLIEDSLIPATEKVGELAEAWGNQTEAAKNAQLATLAGAAIVGPTLSWIGQIMTGVGASILIWERYRTTVIAARLAAVAPIAGLAAGGLALHTLYQAFTPEDFTGQRTQVQFGAQPGALEELLRQQEGPPTLFMGHAQFAPVPPPLPDEPVIEPFTGGGGAFAPPTDPVFGEGIPSTFQFDRRVSPSLGAGPGFFPQESSLLYPPGFRAGFYDKAGFNRGISKPGADPKLIEQMQLNKEAAIAGGDSWYAGLMSNDFLISAGAQAAGALAGGASGSQALLGALPMIGGAIGGPIGGAVGALVGGLFGMGKQRGDTPQNPVHVKVINPGDLATAMLNVTKTFLGQEGAVGLDKLVQQVHDQSLARNLA